jgi:replication factor A1
MHLNKIIEQILFIRQDLTRENILEMIEEKKRRADGYFTDEGAALVLASELGVKLERKSFKPHISIRDLVSGLNDVTVTGRVIIIYSPKFFINPAGKEGKLVNLLLADNSGAINLTLWNDKVELIEAEKVKPGEIIKVLHAYTRERIEGILELHLGLRGIIETLPLEDFGQEYPLRTHFLQKIEKVSKNMRASEVNVFGIVVRIFPRQLFERSDGTKGELIKLLIKDDTGEIILVLWNEKVNEINSIQKGDYLYVWGAIIKESFNGQFELHSKKKTKIEKNLSISN